MSELGELI